MDIRPFVTSHILPHRDPLYHQLEILNCTFLNLIEVNAPRALVAPKHEWHKIKPNPL